MTIQAGSAVLSLAGHDKGKIFAVIGVADQNHVLIADGKRRKIEKPKKKKLKHLKAIGKLDCGDWSSATNRWLKRALSRFVPPEMPTEGGC